MKSTKELLGARIKELRKKRQLSQEELAELVEVDPKHLSRIEVGRGFPSLDTLEIIGRELGCEMKDFFEYSHLDNRQAVYDRIEELVTTADDKSLQAILKIVQAVIK